MHGLIMDNVQPDFVKDFIAEVKEEMENRMLSNVKLSQLSGVSKAAISHLLTGKRNIRFKTAAKLAEGLGMNIVLCLIEK